MDKESPGGVLEQLVNRDHGETDEDAGREIHIEGEDVDVVCGAPALAISGFELQGFNFSEIVRRKRTGGTDFVWVCFLTSLDLRNVKFQIFLPH